MAYDVPKFLKRQDDSLLFAGEGEMIIYCPEIYFDRNDAIVVGEYVNILGILNYAVFDKDGRHNGLKTLYFPTIFLTRPYTIEKMKKIRLTESSEQEDYRALKYKKDDMVVVSTKVPQSIENVEAFYKLFITGHLPTTIDYDKMQNYFIKSMELNGSSYGISLQMFGIIISEMCRDKKDLSRPFRLSGNKNMNDYKMINITDIPKFVSPHSAITSQNWDEAVVGAITTKNMKESPMEKLLMY